MLTSRPAAFNRPGPKLSDEQLKLLKDPTLPENLRWFQGMEVPWNKHALFFSHRKAKYFNATTAAYGPDPDRLYSLFVEVPVGLVWEITSEVYDPSGLAHVQVHELRRPCDEHEFGIHQRQHSVIDKAWLDNVYGYAEARQRQPDMTAIAARHYTYASLNPQADAKDLYEVLTKIVVGSTPGPGQIRYMERSNGKCAAIAIAQGVAEIRFEAVDLNSRASPGGITVENFLRYKHAINKHTISMGEYNT
jgi:hypothetical protein